MKQLALVTGANGHLGNNLVRLLVSQGKNVRASVRNIANQKPFYGLDCEIVYADMLNKQSLLQAMDDVEIIYHVAAVFKHWAKEPQREIIQPNLIGTRNILKAACERGVKKIIYVSSIGTLDHSIHPMNESTWNTDFANMYYKSKTEAEQLAWKLAKEMNLQMVSVLPSSMVGPNTFGPLTPTMGLLYTISKNALPFDPNFCFNYVHVEDVAKGMLLAAQKGKSGERYILATEPSISTGEVINIAQSIFNFNKRPKPVRKFILMTLAFFMEQSSRISGKAPLLLMGNVRHYYNADARIDISKARKDLGYNPRPAQNAIREALMYISKQ